MPEVGQRHHKGGLWTEQLPTTAWMQEVEQRREQLPRGWGDFFKKSPSIPLYALRVLFQWGSCISRIPFFQRRLS
jgi:hypothetical protein